MKAVNLGKYNNSEYSPGASALICVTWYFINILFFVNPLFPFIKIKTWILKLFGATIGQGFIIKPGVNIKYPWKLIIGKNVWIGENVWIDNLSLVRIGNNVCISQDAYLLTGNHNYKKETFDLITDEITLEDGCWIGARALVCPGVNCKQHSVLAVSSVATADLVEFSIYQGNPAVKIRERKID